MKIISWFTHPQAILGVYDFLLSDKHNQSYNKKYPDAWQKLVILVYKVLNMDIFLTKTHRFASEVLY